MDDGDQKRCEGGFVLGERRPFGFKRLLGFDRINPSLGLGSGRQQRRIGGGQALQRRLREQSDGRLVLAGMRRLFERRLDEVAVRGQLRISGDQRL